MQLRGVRLTLNTRVSNFLVFPATTSPLSGYLRPVLLGPLMQSSLLRNLVSTRLDHEPSNKNAKSLLKQGASE